MPWPDCDGALDRSRPPCSPETSLPLARSPGRWRRSIGSTFFDRLSQPAGWVLDYDYGFHGNGGSPLLYAGRSAIHRSRPSTTSNATARGCARDPFFGGHGGEVTALAFSKWRGFCGRRTRFRRERSWLHDEVVTVDDSVEMVAPYHCRIMF